MSQEQPTYVGAIDQGTTSSRFILFDKDGNIGAIDQREHEQINPRAGWVEHDATEIWQSTREVINGAMSDSEVEAGDVEAIGITNQRETAVVWDRETGEPIHNAIVWQDTRTGGLVRELAGDEGMDRLRDVTGLPLSTYFSGPKITWLLDNVDGARERAENGELLFGTTDTWVLWNLTGGKDGGVHVTDVTNASRTLLMDLETLDWHEPALDLMGVPRSMLPEIKSSSEHYADAKGSAIGGRPLAGILGDQQAALFGQTCFEPGDAKNTYGTGSFLLVNTGEEIVRTDALLTTVGYKLGDGKPSYVLEGSIAVTGALIQWLRDRLEIIEHAPDVEELAKTVDDNGGVYFVPAFSGLFAPHWRDDARGVIVGLTGYANGPHRPRRARGHRLAEQGGRRRRQRRRRRPVRRAARRRRHDRQRAADAVPGRRPRRPRHPPEGDRDDRARRRLRGRARGRLLGGPGRPQGALGRGQALGAGDGRRRAGAGLRELEEGGRALARLGGVAPPPGPVDRAAERLLDRRVGEAELARRPASRRTGGRAGTCGCARGTATARARAACRRPRARGGRRARPAAARSARGGGRRRPGDQSSASAEVIVAPLRT